MKLFIAAALIAVAAAGRLEHLERSYLPPDHVHGQQGFNSQGFSSGANGRSSFGANTGSSYGANSGQGSFGASSGQGSFVANSGSGSYGASSGQGSFGAGSGHGSFGASAGRGSFGSSGSFGSGLDSNVIDAAGSFPGATSNQYLPPNYGSSGSNGQFGGSSNGIQRSQYTPQSSSQYPSQYGSASNGLSQPRYQQQQFGANGNSGINTQFPSASNQYLTPKSNYPQQAFDEQTGYQY